MFAWSPSSQIRLRREQMSISQSDLADALGVSKSYLSQVEAGKRLPTDEQIEAISKRLGIPAELLALGSRRLPEDVRAAFEQDPAGAVAAVRQRTEALAVASPRTPRVIPLPKTKPAPSRLEDLPKTILASKGTSSYRAHSYHTKVPPEAIRPFIRAFTRPGETVFDPFCGSGMTGVAALTEGRHALLSDLSPAAVHIARNYTTPCDPSELRSLFSAVKANVYPTMEWLYRPLGADRIVEYTTWSDVYACPACRGRILYWDAVQSGSVDKDGVGCRRCMTVTRKSDLQWVGEEPVESHTSQGGTRIYAHPPTRDELALIETASSAPIPYWTPDVEFGSSREMWRAGHRAMGVNSVADFFTRRNLHALAALRHAILMQPAGRARDALVFAFTAAVNRASRRYQWNAKRPTNVMTGTLYISSLRYEWNVWSLFRRKVADVVRFYESFPEAKSTAEVFQASAADLGCIPDRSIDMVFMDPPFGANIFYADASLLWDAWLGELTDETAEIVVNKHRAPSAGGKTLESYGDLMRSAFANASRVLKAGGRAVLTFSNSDDRVWESVRTALGDAGFDTESVHVMDKGQPSIKGVKGVTGKEHVTNYDMLMCLKHRAVAKRVSNADAPPATLVDQTILQALERGGRNDEIYSAVVRATLEANYSVIGITMPAVARRCAELGAVNLKGRWILEDSRTEEAASEDFVDGYIAKDLPTSSGSVVVDKSIPTLRVPGGRDTTFYTAHSYHTKVPPEAITPFIEHYTRPGDVVLDPFCGSGMTGVAAAMAGRRAILNDLSPAAVHLAWNHTRQCSPDRLAQGFAELERRVGHEIGELYRTEHSDGEAAVINWTMWSSRHRCACGHEFLLWDVMDRKTGRLGSTIECPGCDNEVKRTSLKTLGSEPAWIAYETLSGRRHEKPASKADVERARAHRIEDIENWYPDVPMGPDREMYIRCALQLRAIASVADFYTPRNLRALAIIWDGIMVCPDDRVRRALAFAFTNTAWHGTKMRRFNARGGQRPLTGTLYIPQLSSEANVLEVMRNKIAQLQRYYRVYQPLGVEPPAVTLGSATDLARVADNSIDYVFTDPPFGSNIFYSDCNLIWESWLGRLTDAEREAVVNRSLGREKGGKSLDAYASLIGGAMREISRVLKPGGWATVVFHNTDAAVWQAIRDAAEQAGFSFHEASSLDRKQQSHKGYKGRSGAEDVAHFDVVFNLRKPVSAKHVAAKRGKGLEPRSEKLGVFSVEEWGAYLEKQVETIMRDESVAKYGLQGVHAEIMRRLSSQSVGAFVDYSMIRAIYERAAERVTVPAE